ncbi:phosphoketolase family protein [Lactobacillus jensenii]|jgi:D-xylulose 5-phosphate/D-fructose 6-phosphate phosphoketolase|uniref:Phosphoketolase family protein n=1 Tax=Lactobacillus jensenii TaxID=109790 RepID=A0A5N1IJI9_LACJE|nr:phosphoketolase family protein [Lactobacillus jensenii]EEQ68688.1 D-xylulose 5-phosphate/D-fructose 6-phosphate phosphoketolase [Lactobacillus jensenii 1153]APT14399.1 phosphoketolase [Lactobacillus jensenii]EEQ25051.1 D-xylulose 5-phosphate/D-fructose 6-phosphate phosphoketolase [Lactobacillus jensenii 269-3]EEX28094.1 D-xylulose 5-phosphate/D-fructose 6-phosphate phosphoketolase [Lactobacillus jensenii SJ-7A-US]KAA9236790.1 phosphoketolase family protein [Lactobacillus jensenii]
MTVNFDSQDYLRSVDAYWRAANYLSVGQLFLMKNPLLKTELKAEDVKPKPIGHWGTIVPQNFIYAHLNRVIKKYNLNMFYIEGSGHGGQVMVSNSYLDGSYTERYPEITQDEAGMTRLFKRFSFPGGVASHAAPETPGSIHEGGELGYSLSHGVGAILDNPDVIAAVEIGDGESETGPLAASWFSDKFINPIHDGAVLPILQINGFKISNPTIVSRMSDADLTKYFEGMGWKPYFVNVHGLSHMDAHELMAKTMDKAVEDILAIQKHARETGDDSMPQWPMMVLRAPKGWTGPKFDLDGNPIENSFRAHQIPIPVDQKHMEHKDMLIDWMKSYKPEELFNEDGSPKDIVLENTVQGDQRMAMNPVTNGGINPKRLHLPDWRNYAIDFDKPGSVEKQDMAEWSKYLNEIANLNPTNFRGFGPDESKSNRLFTILDGQKRQWMEDIKEPNDEDLARSGRMIDSQLSEHQAEGWLEGYVLTGRHGFFATYEAFGRVVDSMLTQHMKWLRKAKEQYWRHDYPALNIVDTSTVFQQDHNGYTHQDPGLLTHLFEKNRPDLIHEYLPADTNSLLAVSNKAFADRECINVLVTSKQPRPQWFSKEEAQRLVENGLSYIDWASTDDHEEPDVVFASTGTEPTLETLAAIDLLHKNFPDLKIRYINVLDVMKLQSQRKNPNGLSDEEFDRLFTKNKPVIFAWHGFKPMMESIWFDRHNHNVSIHGYEENGDITTPFDMRVLNEIDRFHLAKDAVERLDLPAAGFVDEMDKLLSKHHTYIRDNGKDIPEVTEWEWKGLN